VGGAIGGAWSGFGRMEGNADFLRFPVELDVPVVLALGYPAYADMRGRNLRNPLDQIPGRERRGSPFTQIASAAVPNGEGRGNRR
jgi:hypothetical protein